MKWPRRWPHSLRAAPTARSLPRTSCGPYITRWISFSIIEAVMSNEQEKINQALKKYGWDHKTFFNRPHWTRRRFFEILGAGVGGTFLANRYAKAADVTATGVITKN